jgi:hypothetical protein
VVPTAGLVVSENGKISCPYQDLESRTVQPVAYSRYFQAVTRALCALESSPVIAHVRTGRARKLHARLAPSLTPTMKWPPYERQTARSHCSLTIILYWQESRVQFAAAAKYVSSHRNVQSGSATHPATYWMDSGAPYLRVKRSGRDVHQSPPPFQKLRKSGAIPLLPYTSSWCGKGQRYILHRH